MPFILKDSVDIITAVNILPHDLNMGSCDTQDKC